MKIKINHCPSRRLGIYCLEQILQESHRPIQNRILASREISSREWLQRTVLTSDPCKRVNRPIGTRRKARGFHKKVFDWAKNVLWLCFYFLVLEPVKFIFASPEKRRERRLLRSLTRLSIPKDPLVLRDQFYSIDSLGQKTTSRRVRSDGVDHEMSFLNFSEETPLSEKLERVVKLKTLLVNLDSKTLFTFKHDRNGREILVMIRKSSLAEFETIEKVIDHSRENFVVIS